VRSLAKACLEAGRHVVLEKPMAASTSEALELCSLARSRDKLLAVNHNRWVVEGGWLW
jgi:predicted dehydrogenase